MSDTMRFWKDEGRRRALLAEMDFSNGRLQAAFALVLLIGGSGTEHGKPM